MKLKVDNECWYTPSKNLFLKNLTFLIGNNISIVIWLGSQEY